MLINPSIIYKDRHFLLFFINAALVIFGYFLAVLTGFQSIGVMKNIRLFFIIISVILLLFASSNLLKFVQANIFSFFLLLTWSFFSILWSENVSYSFSKWLIFAPGIFYLLLFINYSVKRYSFFLTKKFLDISFFLIYLFPIVYFVLFVRNFSSSGIYGLAEESQGFVSNHYGWSASLVSIYLLTSLKSFSFNKHFFLYVILIFSFLILILSSNRAGILSFVLSLMIIFSYFNKIKINQIFVFSFVSLSLFLFVRYQAQLEDSAINFLINKSTSQLESGSEARFVIAEYVFNIFSSDILLFLFGFGFFDNVHIKESGFNFYSYHNSYFDVLFGLGLFGFFLFFRTFYSSSLSLYWKYFRTEFVIVIPLLIIPFFESNLTMGQFLFFPWFSYLLLLSTKKKYIK